jgi:hypothetical protein
MLVALASIKSSPGVTTAALALGACWPAGQRPLVVECDPAGGDVAARFGLAAQPGLVSLAAAARRSRDRELVWRHAQRLPGGLDVVAGPVGAEQARAALDVLADAPIVWSSPGDAALIADCGRLDPRPPTLPVLRAADVTLLVVRNEIGELAHVAERAEQVAGLRARGPGDGRLGLLLVGERCYGRDEIADALGLPVAAVLPADPRGAAALAGRAAPCQVARLPLLRFAGSLARHLSTRHGRQPAAVAAAHPSSSQPAPQRATQEGARR